MGCIFPAGLIEPNNCGFEKPAPYVPVTHATTHQLPLDPAAPAADMRILGKAATNTQRPT